MDKTSVINKYKNTIFLKLIIVILEFACSVLISRALGVSLKGEYTFILNLANLIQLVLVLGIGNSYPVIKKSGRENAKDIVVSMLILSSIGYLILAILLILSGKVNIFIIILSYLLILENQLLFLSIVDDILLKNIITMVITILHLLTLIIIFLFFKNNLFIVMVSVILHHVILITSLAIANHIYDVDWKKYVKIRYIKYILKISLPIMLMNLLMYINYHADIIFLKIFCEKNDIIGLYGVAVTLGNVVWIIPDAFKEMIYNRVSRKDNPNEISFSIAVNFIICIIIFIGFVVFGKMFIKIVYGAEYIGSYRLVLMIFIGTFPMILYKLIHPLYIANGKSRMVVTLLMLAAIVNIVGNIILIPAYSGMGAAVSTIISYSICGIIFYIKFRIDYNTNLFLFLKNKNIKKIISLRKD